MACRKLSAATKRYKLRSVVGLLFVEDQVAANPNGGILSKKNVKGLLDCFMPSISCLQQRSYHHHKPVVYRHSPATQISLLAVSPAIHSNVDINKYSGFNQVCSYSTKPQDTREPEPKPVEQENVTVQEEKSLTIYQRFKQAYKEYGKVLIGVHVATSIVWFGSFYYAAYSGIDVTPILERLGVGETVLNFYRKPGIGNAAVAYLLYKIATPARYTVTIGGTQMSVKLLRKAGYMERVPEGSSIRELVKDSREQFKDKYDDMKVDIKDKYGEAKGDFKDKVSELKMKRKIRHEK